MTYVLYIYALYMGSLDDHGMGFTCSTSSVPIFTIPGCWDPRFLLLLRAPLLLGLLRSRLLVVAVCSFPVS